MKKILKDNFSVLFPYFILLCASLLTIIIRSKADTHLFFNSYHNSFFDLFFYFFTYMGDGVTALLVVIILIAIKYRFAIIVALSVTVSAMITQGLKHFVFSDVARPKKFFEGLHELYFVPGVENHLNYSFPSGHTTCAFSLYMAIAFIVKQKRYKTFFFLLALFTGYSRVYLSQHFLEDITAGSVIGTLTAILVFTYFNSKENNWMNSSLIETFRKSQ